MKHLLPAMLALAAPAALAWPSCNQAGLSPPVALARETPAYPAAVRAIGIEGTVEVALTILRNGRVGWVNVVRADPPGYFEQAAVAGVRGWRFEPARQNGTAVECRMLTRVRFTLVDTVDAAGEPLVRSDRPDPVYPARLLAERVEGYAELQFELAADGSVLRPRVITAMPRGEFESAALAAIRSWRFPPEPVARRMTRRFEFRLPDSSLGEVPPIMLASAPFPMEACERRQTGSVSLEVATDATGAIRQARILSSEPRGLFDGSALAIAKASRMTPAYRDGQPVTATALLTLFFDPDQASCPGSLTPDPQRPTKGRPPPAVSRHDERPSGCADRWAALSVAAGQQVPLGNRRQPAAVQLHGSPR
jgi:TonB family protein